MWSDFLFENFICSDFAQIKRPLIVGTCALGDDVSGGKERCRKYGGRDDDFQLKGNSHDFYLPLICLLRKTF